MKKITSKLLIGVCLFSLSCKKKSQEETLQKTEKISAIAESELSASAVNLDDYALTLEDNFDGVGPLNSRWNYRAENTVRGYATILRSNVFICGKWSRDFKIGCQKKWRYFYSESNFNTKFIFAEIRLF
jgi:hypothetical protein